jgi:hypothetical protein
MNTKVRTLKCIEIFIKNTFPLFVQIAPFQLTDVRRHRQAARMVYGIKLL